MLVNSQKTILVADDEKVILTLIRRTLEPAGYKVLGATDGIMALRLGESNPRAIDLLITDIRMPGLNGKELADALCKVKSDLKILFISGYSEYSFKDLNPCGNNHGHFLPKPFHPSDLLKKVGEILGMEEMTVESEAETPVSPASREGGDPGVKS
jgi:two-component system cell cycle sensor histidine kinase/response regulator CckA